MCSFLTSESGRLQREHLQRAVLAVHVGHLEQDDKVLAVACHRLLWDMVQQNAAVVAHGRVAVIRDRQARWVSFMVHHVEQPHLHRFASHPGRIDRRARHVPAAGITSAWRSIGRPRLRDRQSNVAKHANKQTTNY